jgi:hypothetical protein
MPCLWILTIATTGKGIEAGIVLVLRLTVIVIIAIGVIVSDITETGAEIEAGKGNRRENDMAEIEKNATAPGQGKETVNESEIVLATMHTTVAGTAGTAMRVAIAGTGTEAGIGTANVNAQTVRRNLGLHRNQPRIVKGARPRL